MQFALLMTTFVMYSTVFVTNACGNVSVTPNKMSSLFSKQNQPKHLAQFNEKSSKKTTRHHANNILLTRNLPFDSDVRQ